LRLAADAERTGDLPLAAQQLRMLIVNQLGGRAEMEECHRRAVRFLDRATASGGAGILPERAELHNHLGVQLRSWGKRSEAETQFRRSRAVYEQFAATPDAPYEAKVGLCGTCCNLGILLYDDGKYEESIQLMDDAIIRLRGLSRPDRPDPLIRSFLRNCYLSRVLAYRNLNRHDKAAVDCAAVIEFSPPNEKPLYTMLKIEEYTKCGRAVEVIADVEEMLRSPNLTYSRVYVFAGVYSTASVKSPDKKVGYANRAIELLQRAVNAGLGDVAHIKANADLDPIRGREEFKKLLADLEAKFPPPREVLPAPRRE
jgi:tetratricopeptide (TPR) repeat protein